MYRYQLISALLLGFRQLLAALAEISPPLISLLYTRRCLSAAMLLGDRLPAVICQPQPAGGAPLTGVNAVPFTYNDRLPCSRGAVKIRHHCP